MFGLNRLVAAVALTTIVTVYISGCTIGAAYLIYDELQSDDPMVAWQGQVTDSAGDAVPDVIVMVQFKLEQKDVEKTEELTFQGTTDVEGRFNLEARFSKFAKYSVVLVYLDQSFRPPHFQDIYIADEHQSGLEFTFDVHKPEEEHTWSGTVKDGDSAAANGALVRLDLTGVEDERTYWAVARDGGSYAFDYAWTQTGIYTLSVYYRGVKAKLVKIFDPVAKETWSPETDQQPDDGDDSAGNGDGVTETSSAGNRDIDVNGTGVFKTLPAGDQYFNLTIEKCAEPPEELKTLSGTVRLAAGSPALDALVILDTSPAEGSTTSATTTAAPMAWDVSGDQGEYSIEYKEDGVTHFAVELVYAGHSYDAVDRQELSETIANMPETTDFDIMGDGVVEVLHKADRTWAGTVKDQNSNNVPSAVILIECLLPGEELPLKYWDLTDDNGAFSVEFLWCHNVAYTIRVLHSGTPGDDDVHEKDQLPNKDIDDEAFLIQMPDDAPQEEMRTWAGSVVDQEQSPVVSAIVIIQSSLPDEERPKTYGCQTDADGSFSIDFLWRDGASYWIQVLYGDSYAKIHSQEEDPIANANVEGFEITVE